MPSPAGAYPTARSYSRSCNHKLFTVLSTREGRFVILRKGVLRQAEDSQPGFLRSASAADCASVTASPRPNRYQPLNLPLA